jgi:hypothetical protein
MKPKIFTIMLVLIVTACRTSKIQLQQGNSIQLKKAYVQKIVPGMEGMKIKDYLFLELETYNIKEYFIDSIYFLNKVYHNKRYALKYKIDLSQGNGIQNPQYTSNNKNIATIFYHQNNNPFYLNITGIFRKKTLYMP